ncbi:hypothetical protein CPLU01_05910 [Colletotrichum plurivorum]|uniref:Uncharacterized protein n=1 Tax=Colletotrichum plurivorum TaxID=2175906 RepID=A0A8H6KKM6_9PEZI|nr:hypothetical protein CPLU01_05910 [Colletotrichum plurivorum]
MSRLHSTPEYTDVAVAVALSQTSVLGKAHVTRSVRCSHLDLRESCLAAWRLGRCSEAGYLYRRTLPLLRLGFPEYSIPLFVVAMPVAPRPIKYQQQPILAEQKREGENEGQAFS